MPQLLLVGAPDFLTDEDVRNKITIDFDVLVSAVTRSPEGIYVTIHNAAAADLVFAAGCLKFKGVDYTLQWHATPCHEVCKLGVLDGQLDSPGMWPTSPFGAFGAPGSLYPRVLCPWYPPPPL